MSGSTATERSLLRLEFTETSITLPDATIDLLYDAMVEAYGESAARRLITAAVNLKYLRQKIIAASRNVDYSEGGSSESAGQTARNLISLLPQYTSELETAIVDTEGSAAMWAGMKKLPRRDKEYPDA